MSKPKAQPMEDAARDAREWALQQMKQSAAQQPEQDKPDEPCPFSLKLINAVHKIEQVKDFFLQGSSGHILLTEALELLDAPLP